MRSRIAAILAVALLLGGCGVARETDVARDRPGPNRGVGTGTDDSAEASTREATTEPRQFVTNFLRSAAGDHQTALNRARKFLLPGIADRWRPKSADPLVVRPVRIFTVTPRGVDNATVFVQLQPIGWLTDQGTVEPIAADDPARLPIERDLNVVPAEPAGQIGKFLSDADVPYILLLTSALTPPTGVPTTDNDVLYRPYLLYFWDKEARVLVPDLRYLARTLPVQQRPTEVVRRLLGGPSTLLRTATKGLPADTDLRGSVVLEGDTLVVDLNAKATSVPAEQLVAQLRWSLWDLHDGPINLLVEGQFLISDPGETRYLAANPATSLSASPIWFCVAGHVVFASCEDPARQQPPSILASADNKDVRSAAIALRTDATYGALVTGPLSGTYSLRVGRAQSGGKASYKQAVLTGRDMSRPVWMYTTSREKPSGLIAVNGELHVFDWEQGDRGPLTGLPGKITAVSAAPDARRIAIIAGGRVYVAALSVRGNTITAVDWRPLMTTLGSLRGVAWTRSDRLVVAGSGRLTEVTVDGAVEEWLEPETGRAPVTQLVAHPDGPTNGSTRGRIFVELDGSQSYEVFTTSLSPIQKTGTPPPSPAPTTPAKPPTVIAPFFLE